MDGLGQAVGNGIVGLVGGAFDAIGGVLRGMVNAGNQVLPNGLFWVIIFVVLVAGGWTLAKR
jgi:Flp pilus assembly pilin Flp